MPPTGQRIEPLNDDDPARICKQRTVIERYLGGDAENLRKYQFAAGKLGLLQALLERGVLQPTQTYELQCMGVVLGGTTDIRGGMVHFLDQPVEVFGGAGQFGQDLAIGEGRGCRAFGDP